MLSICQSGYENALSKEWVQTGLVPASSGPGWVRGEGMDLDLAEREFAFAQVSLADLREVSAESVNGLAQGLNDFFLESLRGERVEQPWACVFDGPSDLVGLGRRIGAVEKAFFELLKKRLSRVAKLARRGAPSGQGRCRGLFVWFVDFQRCLVAREACLHGQCRMADDDLAPSRSYLKVEEAYRVLGLEPSSGETVVDLGAAPGGWSYSAAKRGARVVAVDNGPLKGGALGHPNIEHRMEDAFHYMPPGGAAVDWLFCDMVEEPHHVLRNIVEPWLAGRRCHRYVINLKFGRVDPLGLLRELRAANSPFSRYSAVSKVRHLYHDREEFTVVGELRAPDRSASDGLQEGARL